MKTFWTLRWLWHLFGEASMLSTFSNPRQVLLGALVPVNALGVAWSTIQVARLQLLSTLCR